MGGKLTNPNQNGIPLNGFEPCCHMLHLKAPRRYIKPHPAFPGGVFGGRCLNGVNTQWVYSQHVTQKPLEIRFAQEKGTSSASDIHEASPTMTLGLHAGGISACNHRNAHRPSCPVVPFLPFFWEGCPFNVNQPKKGALLLPWPLGI